MTLFIFNYAVEKWLANVISRSWMGGFMGGVGGGAYGQLVGLMTIWQFQSPRRTPRIWAFYKNQSQTNTQNEQSLNPKGMLEMFLT